MTKWVVKRIQKKKAIRWKITQLPLPKEDSVWQTKINHQFSGTNLKARCCEWRQTKKYNEFSATLFIDTIFRRLKSHNSDANVVAKSNLPFFYIFSPHKRVWNEQNRLFAFWSFLLIWVLLLLLLCDAIISIRKITFLYLLHSIFFFFVLLRAILSLRAFERATTREQQKEKKNKNNDRRKIRRRRRIKQEKNAPNESKISPEALYVLLCVCIISSSFFVSLSLSFMLLAVSAFYSSTFLGNIHSSGGLRMSIYTNSKE